MNRIHAALTSFTSPFPRQSQFSDSDDIISDISSDWSVFAQSPAPRQRRTIQMLSPGPRGILKRPIGAQQGSEVIRRARSAEPLDQSRRNNQNGDNNHSHSLERGGQKVTHAPPAVSARKKQTKMTVTLMTPTLHLVTLCSLSPPVFPARSCDSCHNILNS